MKKYLIALFAVAVSFTAFAQTPGSGGLILYADGSDMSVFRNKVLNNYDPGVDNVVGTTLLEGDLVQTGPGTTIEIQLLPTKSIIKIAENTSFRLTAIQAGKSLTIDLLYGRIRSKVDTVAGTNGFNVRGKTAYAGVRGTDFGFDVIAAPGGNGETSSNVYTFEGTVTLVPIQDPNAGSNDSPISLDDSAGKKTYPISAGQSGTVSDNSATASQDPHAGNAQTVQDGNKTVVISNSIPDSIKDYWSSHEIISKPEDSEDTGSQTPKPQSQVGTGSSVETLKLIDPLLSIRQKQYVITPSALKTAGIFIATLGLIGDVAGLVVNTFGTDIFKTSSDVTQTAGLVTISGGAVLSISGIAIYLSTLLK